ncbi:snurportin-1 isoform X1 [Schistocerca serialis cubense]|uniref:snurportin-1 isoform X1 n=2 Tax=Schistocerca serialis cubense TaxID=2023355 RepID=UPI00214F2EDC|nr:snurportin-1 isoform X1 [Schistocerca serialis cubense]
MNKVSQSPKVASEFADYYKARSKVKDQEERRQLLLHEQKRSRDESFNKTRGLLVLEEDLEDESMDCTTPRVARKWPYYGVLMMSEWLLQVPADLDSKWFVVPCPVGKRTLVVSSRRGTRAYDKRGLPTASFQSVLPAGTMLDCVWCREQRKYFVLDVLMWNRKTLLDCETEFRSYWMETKFQQENSEATEKSAENPFPFLPLPYRRCTMDAVGDILSGVELPGGSLDGLLFYHSESHYTAGSTPLVGWLKPHMIPEVLGVDVHPRYLEERPSDYESVAVYVQKSAIAKRNKQRQHQRRRNRSRNKIVNMETECLSDGSPTTAAHDVKEPDAAEFECDISNELSVIDISIEDVSSDSPQS